MEHPSTVAVADGTVAKGTVAIEKRLLLTVARLAVSGALIYWILRGANLGEVFAAIRSVNMPLLVLAFSLHGVGYYVSSHRWLVLLRAQAVVTSIPFLIKSYMVSAFFNNFLPSTIGGDVVRAYDSWRVGKSKAGAVAVIFVDRLLGMLALILFALLALLASKQLTVPFLYLWVLAGAVGMLLVVWLIFNPPERISTLRVSLPFFRHLLNILSKIATAFLAFRGRKDVLAKALALSVVLQANVIIHYYLIGRALDFPVPFFEFFLVVPLAIFVMMLPVSINAIGLRENAFVFLFATFGVSTPEAVAFAWLAYGMLLINALLGGLVYALRR